MAKRARIADVERLLKSFKAGGVSLAAVDVLPGGVYRVLIGEPVDVRSGAEEAPEENEWDQVLPGAA